MNITPVFNTPNFSSIRRTTYKISKNNIKQIKDLKKENESLKEELNLVQKAVNELLFNSLGGE